MDDRLKYPGAWVDDRADKPAVIMAGSGEQMSYGELHATANRFARLLGDLGLEPGDHVSLCLENRVDYLALVWGARYAGLYYTLVNAKSTPAEIAYVVADSGAKALVLSLEVQPERRGEVEELCPGTKVLVVGGDDDESDVHQLLESRSAEDLEDPVEGQEMLYSSGTTGHPKGIKRPLTGLPLGSSPGATPILQLLLGVTDESVYLAPAPLYHASSYAWVHAITSLGATAVIMERFDAEAALASIDRHGVTHSQWVPTMLRRMINLPEEVKSQYDLSSHQVAAHAAAPCPVELKHALIDWWGPILFEYYGGTENVGATFCTSEDWLAHPGTVGRPMLGEIHVVGPDGEELPVGSEGLIYFSGGPDFEYHGDPEKTAKSRTKDGWGTFGDIGRIDEDGFLYLTDRANFVINRGGVNVYPQEAENLLSMHPSIEDVAVIAVPDAELGQEVKAVVQLRDGVVGDGDLEASLLAHCRERLASYKCPRSIDFRDELPRGENGKLYKHKLQDEYWSERSSRLH